MQNKEVEGWASVGGQNTIFQRLQAGEKVRECGEEQARLPGTTIT